MTKYSKNLAGQSLKLFVGAAAAYATDTTLSAFLANGTEGQIGVYLSNGSLQSTALSPGDEFVIVQKRDGFLNKTPIIKWSEIIDSRKSAYVAPIRQVSTIGYNGTSGDLGVVLTTATTTNTLTFGVSVREVTPGNQPFPIQEGYATATSTTADVYSIVAGIVSTLNGDFDYQRTQPDRFVKAEILSDGTLTGLGQTAAVVNGSVSVTAGAAVTLADKSFLSLAGVIYRVNGTVTSSTAIVLDRPFQGTTATLASGTSATTAATAAYTSGTTKFGIKLTGLEDTTIFKIAGSGLLTNATVTNTTAWLLGAGSGASIVEFEKQGQIFDGPGSTVNAAFKDDYGQPTKFAVSTTNYDQYFLQAKASIFPSAAAPVGYQQEQSQRVVIAVPSTGTTPTATLQIVFGL